MTLSAFTDKFVSEKEGNTYGFPDGSYVGECLSLAKLFIQEFYGIYPPASGCNGARCYWSLFPNPLGTVLKKVPNTPDLIPEKGWIVVWNKNAGGGYGHIAIVLEANINSFTSFDQNYYGKHAHKQNHNYTNVEGFLVPIKDVSSTDETMQPNYQELFGVKTIEELKTVWDREMGFLKSEREKNENLTSTNKALVERAYNTEILYKNYVENLNELLKPVGYDGIEDSEKVKLEIKKLMGVEDQLNVANKNLMQEEKKHELEKSEMQKEIDNLKAEIAQDKADRDATEKKLLGRIESLELRLNDNESASDATNQFKTFIDRLLKIFTKEK